MLASEYSTVIVNTHQLQLMALMPGASYTLAANIDASATARGGASGGDVWSTTGGFFPIGTGQMGGFTGSFDGLGHTISNLTIAWPAELAYVGLFGNAQPGSIIKNVGLIAASVAEIGVSGFSQPANGTGALVGTNQGSISNSYATGVVSGSSYVGGLVGNNYGALSSASISNSHATVAVNGNSRVGGLAGGNYGSGGSITNSYATGAVVGSSTAGGLLGWNNASIANSYATGTATGNINVGGLVGANSGSIANAYATGNVTGNSYVGGLVGVNMSSIANAYATGDVSGSGSVGGLVGYNHAGISNTYATGNVVGSAYVGGLVGTNLGSISNSFWNSEVIAIGVGADGGGYGTFTGGRGLSTVEMHEMSSFAVWSISNSSGSDVWQIYEGSTAPLLSSFLTPLTVTASNASTVFNGVGFNGNGVTYSVTPNGNLLGTLSYGTAQDAVGAGSYAITPTGLYSNQQGYSITVVSANLTIAPLALTGSIGAGSSVYGSALTPGVAVFANLIPGYTTVSGGTAAVSTAGNLSTSNHLKAGSYAGSESVGSTLTGADAGDYTFTGATGDYTVSPLALTVAATGANKVYDGTTSDAPTLSGGGVILGDHVSFAYTAANFGGKNVGSGQAVSVSGITLGGPDAADYALNSTSAMATATISPASLTVSGITAGNKVYDGNAAAILAGGSLVGVAAGDTGLVVLTDAGNFASQNVGTGLRVAAAETLSGAGAGNYVLVQPTGLIANITPATLIYEATPASRTAGQSLAGFSGSLSGFVAGETQVNDTIGTLAWTTPATAGSRTGLYAIEGSGLTASNYVFVEARGNAAALTLGPAPALPPGARSAIAGLQTAVLFPVAAQSALASTSIDSTDSAGDPTVSSWDEYPVADTARMIGPTSASLRIVNGGVRLPK
jgi:hypothetical protein